ncbi:MAG: phospholipase D-like domain-containing protein [Melioribacteraceae bacterium]|nr:phospholipase D-like domain-containing protein [Melioribacteraceae bacterium]
MKSRKDFFQVLNAFPHNLAVYLTFTLDKAVIEKIAENTYANVIILYDYRQGVSLKNNWGNRIVCIPVILENVHQENCFHAKLALLKGEVNAKLLIGSSNLAKNSFTREKEICLETELDFNSGIYNDVIDFIESLSECTLTSSNVLPAAITKLRYLEERKSNESELNFIHNSEDTSIYSILKKYLSHEEQPIIKIASPYLSKDFRGDVAQFIDFINPKEVHLYLRNNYPIPEECKLFPDLKIYEPKRRSLRKGFHAKIISVEYGNKEIIFIGSANFSRQGFFMSLDEKANYETGIIISDKNKNIIADWFNSGWEKSVPLSEWEEDPNLADEREESFPLIPYIWAEKLNDKLINLYFYLPYKEQAERIIVNGESVTIRGHNNYNDIYSYKLNSSSQSVRVEIEETEYLVTVFDETEFEKRGKEIGESLFNEIYPIDSVNREVLTEAIEREGIKTKVLESVIVEPPYLEQYFYNVKSKIAHLERRKYFNEYHYSELSRLIETIKGGEGIYFLLQLLKCFDKKKLHQITELCKSRINKPHRDNSKFNESSIEKFYNQWKKY